MATDYAGLGLKLAPLDIDHLSWPSGAAEPKAVADLIGPGGSEWVEEFLRTTVPPKADGDRAREELGLSRPYSDSRLRGRQYRVRLSHELFKRHLVEWALEDGTSTAKGEGVRRAAGGYSAEAQGE